MYRMNIHGVPFYGRYNPHHFKSLFKVAEVTNAEDWKGLTAVYSNDGYIPPSDDFYGGLYVQYEATERFTLEQTHAHLLRILDQRGVRIEAGHIYKSPFIYVYGNVLKRETDFAFNLLHELGHHVERKLYGHTLSHRDSEVFAHKFALRHTRKIFTGKYVINEYSYLREAYDELELELKEAEKLIKPDLQIASTTIEVKGVTV